MGDIITNHINATTKNILDIMSGDNTLAHRAGDIAPTNVKDVCNVHVAAMESDAASGKRYLCAPYMVTVPELLQMIKDNYPRSAEVVTAPPKEPMITGTWGKARTTSNKLFELGIKSCTPPAE